MIKLKDILENVQMGQPTDGRAPTTPGLIGQQKKLSSEEKKQLAEMVARFNEYGTHVRDFGKVMKVAEDLLKISEMAETYAVNESGDWMEANTVKRNMKDLHKLSEEFYKHTKECWNRNQQMEALYEEIGHTLGRYFEIKEPVVSQPIQ